LSYFRNKFGVEPAKRFSEPLQRLKDWGFLAIAGDEVLLNRDGLLQVDRLLHEFFLPQHRTNRYV
jgi:oxygen-independent coproporphyrinogen-3 oxidase